MAFFDKLNQVAKNLGDKTTDAIETTKLNSKINSEKSAAAEDYKKIGEFYYNAYLSGYPVAPEVMEFCQSAKAHHDAAAEAQAEIERIKAENEMQAAAPAQAIPPAQQAAPVQPAPSAGGFCMNCGAPLTPGTKFCSGCGTKVG